MNQSERVHNVVRDGSRDASPGAGQSASGCLVCGKPLMDTRSKFCSPAHRQLAYRLRRRAVIREMFEETSLKVEPTEIVGIYSDPGHIIAYADGEVRQEFSICFTARIVDGQLTVGDTESTEVRFVKASELEQLSMGSSTRIRIQHFLERRTVPYFA